MTETITRGAANQAGAHINPNADAEAQDFLPLKGIDHVEFWVGNAKQAAPYYRALWGFTPVAYAGLETGVRDRTSWVMRQNDITFVFTGALTPDGEIAEHVHRHGDGVHDIAFAVDDATSAWRETTNRGRERPGARGGGQRRGRHPPSVRDPHLRRGDPQLHRPQRLPRRLRPGFRKVRRPARAAGGLSCSRSTTASATSSSAT